MRFAGTFQDMLELAASLCCCPGSGGGSGSGGALMACCENGWSPGQASWEVSGVTCVCTSGTQLGADTPGCEYITDTMPDGFQLRGGIVRIANSCLDVPSGIGADVLIEVCCIENIADPTRTQLWLYFRVDFSGPPVGSDVLPWLRQYLLSTPVYDIGSCEAGILEVINRPLELIGSRGAAACTFPDPRVTIVLT